MVAVALAAEALLCAQARAAVLERDVAAEARVDASLARKDGTTPVVVAEWLDLKRKKQCELMRQLDIVESAARLHETARAHAALVASRTARILVEDAEDMFAVCTKLLRAHVAEP